MPFQPPPTLPDYSKLVFMLNQSGVQKWNPAVYDILKNLIQAVQQSQDVIAPAVAEAASGGGSGLTFVSVDPLGALSGDGTPSSPLAVIPDGVSITINGSNQLAVIPSGALLSTTGTVSNAQLNSLATSPITILAGIANEIHVPVVFLGHTFTSVAWTNSRNATLEYANNPGSPIMTLSQIMTNSIIQHWFVGGIGSVLPFTDVAGGNPESQDIKLIGNANNTAGDAANFFAYNLIYVSYPMP